MLKIVKAFICLDINNENYKNITDNIFSENLILLIKSSKINK